MSAAFGYPFTGKNLRQFVQRYLNHKGVQIKLFHENLRGCDWTIYFLKRNKELSVRFSENLKRARADVNEEVINTYFDQLGETLANVPPQNLVNYDESNLTDDPGNKRVIVRRGCKHPSRIMDASKASTSIMFAGAADGTLLSVYIVYKARNLYPEWVLGGPSGALYNRSESGWFDGDIFEDWFTKVAIPYFRRLEGKKK